MTDYLYHVTFYNRLQSIDEDGLQPGRGRGIGAETYDTHREGAVFLTEASGVYFWGSRAEEWAHNMTDDIYEEGWAPVLLRIPDVYEEDCESDELGTQDARHDAFKCRTEIFPGDIEVWAGIGDEGKWVPIEEWGEIPYDDAFQHEEPTTEAEWEDYPEGWWILKDVYGTPSPLVPKPDSLEVQMKALKRKLLR